jgi:siroheme synthase
MTYFQDFVPSMPTSYCSCICKIIQVFAELKDLAQRITSAELVSPTLIIIGKVVALSPLWPLSLKEASCLVEAN